MTGASSRATITGLAPPAVHPALRDNPLLAGLPPDQAAAIAERLVSVQVEAETEVVCEGARDRTMYFVLAGEARADRGGITVAHMGAGQHFGELSLIVDQPRAASVTAATRLELAALSYDGYRSLADQHPRAALHLLEAVIEGVRSRLTEVTDSLGALLRERSLPRRAQVEVRIGGLTRLVPTGAPVGTLIGARDHDLPVVAALIDRRPVPLSERVVASCSIEALTPATIDGQRIHRRSLGLLLLEAAHRIDPALRLRLGHSLGFGQRVEVDGRVADELPGVAASLERTLAELVAADLPVREELWYVDEARDHFADAGWADAVELLDNWQATLVPVATFGKVHAIALDPPGPGAGVLGGARVLADGDELILVYPPAAAARAVRDDDELRAAKGVAQRMTSAQDRWLEALGIDSVGAFNRTCIRGRVAELIRVAEGFHEKRVSEIADRIAADRQIRVVAIAGPSSSGKTTFIKRLRTQLQVVGLAPAELSLDDYYVDREATPRDSSGEYDFEAFEALQIDLLRDHLEQLCAGQSITVPRYDFHTGASVRGGGRPLRLADGDVLLLEGLHGLNPRLLDLTPAGTGFVVFVCPLAQLPFDRLSRVHASDVRLVRRIVRDRHGRSIDAASTIARWPSVRRGERRHIFPYQHRADAVLDTSLIYELSVLKVYAQRYLLEVPHEHPSYTTAYRLQQLLDQFVPIYPDHVPPTSFLREFIGGGGFEY